MTAKRQYNPEVKCVAKKADGTRCNGSGVESKGRLCNIHFAIKHGEKLPQQHRTKKIGQASIPVMLRKFGMPAKDVTQLRKAFPDLDATIIGNASVDAIMVILYKVLVMKAIAVPKAETMSAVVVAANFIKNAEGLSVDPNDPVGDVADFDNGDWETPEGLR